jgi:hypothetical protein
LTAGVAIGIDVGLRLGPQAGACRI